MYQPGRFRFIVNFRKLGVIVVLCLIAVICSLMYIRDNIIEKKEFVHDVTDLSKNYEAVEEIQEALKKRQETDIMPAEVITTLKDGTPRVAIVFDGMTDYPTTAKILDVLKKHNAEAVFFLEGENAADVPAVIKLINDAGQGIGNYTYVGLAAVEKSSTERQLQEMCRTQKVITMNNPSAPTLFRAPRSVYTDDLLKSVRAAGLEYAVKENVRFKPGTLHNQEEANAYAASIANGSIVAVACNRPVEKLVTDPLAVNEKPAVDMKPTIKEDKSAAVPARLDLPAELDLLLTALEQRGVKVVLVNQFRKIYYIPADGAAVQNSSQEGAAK